MDLEPTRASAICSGCGETKKRIHDVKPARTWRHTDLWNMPTLVRVAPRRVRCRHCGVRIEQVPWARTRSRYTHQFEAEVLRRARDCSISGVCRQLGLHWTSVMRLIERWVEESAEKQFRRPLRVLGVDEVSYGRGHSKYLTIVWDHVRARVVWIGQGRERDTLDAFFTKLGRRRSHRLEAVTMDMWQGYIGSVQAHAPQAAIVFDRFHIERYLTKAIDEVREQEFFRRGGAYRDAIRVAINAIANGCRVAAERDAELRHGAAQAARQRRRPQRRPQSSAAPGAVLGLVADRASGRPG